MSDCIYTQEGDEDREIDAIYLPPVKQNLLTCSVCRVSQEVLETIKLKSYSCSQGTNIQLKVSVCVREREGERECNSEQINCVPKSQLYL